MPSRIPGNYFRQHSALSDWLRPADPDRRGEILAEDASREDRLQLTSEIIGIPILRATKFTGHDIVSRTAVFRRFEDEAQGAYAVRGVRLDDETVVLRNRNLTVPELITWLENSVDDLRMYSVEFSPHVSNEWSAIFVVTSGGIIGEIIRGSLRLLTQGDDSSVRPRTFTFDFEQWKIDPDDSQYQAVANSIVESIRVDEGATRRKLSERIGASFVRDRYLMGYFEAIVGPGGDVRFIDFNMTLGRQFDEQHLSLVRRQLHENGRGPVRGMTASRGEATGTARVLIQTDSAPFEIGHGQILVCAEPTPDIVAILQRAHGVIADRGGILSHASIVCRELGIPCIVGTNNATELIADGSRVHLDADAGVAHLL